VLGVIRDWLDRRRALKQLRKAQRDDIRDFREFFGQDIEAARRALDRGEHTLASEIWVKARAPFPDLAIKAPEALELMLDLGRFDEAEEMLREGQKRHPKEASIAVGYARVAERRGEPEEAVRRCETLLHKFPDCTAGYTLGADCLDTLKRHDEAEALLARGVQKLPTDFKLLCAHAMHAEQRGDFPTAVERWRLVERSEHPIVGMLAVGRCLMALQRFAEAEDVLNEASERFPTNGYTVTSMARLHTLKGNAEEAMRTWRLARERFPGLLVAYTGGAEAAREFGREAEADEILREATERFPYELALHLNYARAAHRRREWAAAAERWAVTAARFPANAEAREKHAEATAMLNG